MSQLLEFIRLTLSQFAGGPGPPENNLVRFGLAALFWMVLLAAAFSRRRAGTAPREQLLVWGFGLGLVRELWMFGHMAGRVMSPEAHSAGCVVSQPAEHTLSMAAVVVVAGAFLQFILNDQRRARRFIAAGLTVALVSLLLTTITWTLRHAPEFEVPFHQAWQAWLFHLPLTLMLAYAIAAISRGHGWLRNVVIAALLLFLISEALVLFNYATGIQYNSYLCPIGNSLHIIAIPLLGFVYYKEQANEKNRAESALHAYRNRLEELVGQRTAELQVSNDQLALENRERRLAEEANARHNAELAARNKLAATLSQSLDQDVLLNSALATVLTLVRADVGLITLLDPHRNELVMNCQVGHFSVTEPNQELVKLGACHQAAIEAMAAMETVISKVADGETCCAPIDGGQLRQLISTPLVAKGKPVGALILGRKEPKTLDGPRRALLTAFGQQIGLAEENARHHEVTKQAAASLDQLHMAAEQLSATLSPELVQRLIVEQAGVLLDSPAVYLLSFDTQDRYLDQLAHHGAAAPAAIDMPAALLNLMPALSRTSGAAPSHEVLESDIAASWGQAAGFGSALGVRLLKVEGSILLLYLLANEGREWRLLDKELLERFSHLAAAALANARLHRQLERSSALEERHRIAAELHDGLAQTLSVAAMTLDETKLALGQADGSPAMRQLAQLEEAVRRANVEARTSIKELHQEPAQPQSLQQLLRALMTADSPGGGPKLKLHVRLPRPHYLTPSQRALLLPLVKEAVHNARKHAHAEQIDVTIESAGQDLCLSVIDNGDGFDPEAVIDDGAGHFGLGIMRARAARMPGTLTIASQPGQGTRVQLRWRPEEGKDGEGLPLRSRLVEENGPVREVLS